MTAPTGALVATRDEAGVFGFDAAFDANDSDGDEVAVDIAVAVDDRGNDGIVIARGLPAAGVHHVSLVGVPRGVWHVFAIASDPRGGIAYGYAAGTIEVPNDGVADATFELIEPDGVADIDADGISLITWRAGLPDGQTATVALFLDVGSSETPLAGGLVATGESPTFALDTNNLAPGQYTVRGVMTHQGGQVTRSADGVLVVAAEGCACVAADRGVSRHGGALPGAALVAMLLLFVATRRRDRVHGPTGP
jgi:hypothetical protein